MTRELLGRLAAIPQHPRPVRSLRHLPQAVQSLADFFAGQPPWLARVRRQLRPYPAPFRKVTIPSWDGTPLTGWMGVHRGGKPSAGAAAVPREGLLLVPGMFASKDVSAHRARAVRIFREWGYHVLTLDLRGMGESARLHNTAGWKESEDVEAALDYFRAHAPLEKVHIYGESMGGVAAILAAARQARRDFRLVDGAILALCPFPDARRLMRRLRQAPRDDEMLALSQWVFAQLLTLGGFHHPTFDAYLREAARRYGVGLAELYRRSTIAPDLRRIKVPTLLVVSDDDPLVPPRDQRLFVAALGGRPNPAMLRLTWGNHCLHEMLDPDWFWALLHEFFDFYCALPRR